MLAISAFAGFAAGIWFRAAFDPIDERTLKYFILSGTHGAGLAITAWFVQLAFAQISHTPLGLTLRRWPLAMELLARAIVTTMALLIVGLSLQALLYAGSQRLDWMELSWFEVEMPRIVGMAFALSLGIGILSELSKFIGAPLLGSLLLGTYQRPSRHSMIVMFLDLADSTRLAESLGEVRVHDLITKFFSDIDESIVEHGGTVHAYVGDEVIVSWPISMNYERNARAVACYFAIERKIAALAGKYAAEFGVVPTFRAGIHAGPVVVSVCGDSKRQLAFFGDTLNVTARLCEHCKTIGQRLVASEDLIRLMGPMAPTSHAEKLAVRGRDRTLGVVAIEEPPPL